MGCEERENRRKKSLPKMVRDGLIVPQAVPPVFAGWSGLEFRDANRCACRARGFSGATLEQGKNWSQAGNCLPVAHQGFSIIRHNGRESHCVCHGKATSMASRSHKRFCAEDRTDVGTASSTAVPARKAQRKQSLTRAKSNTGRAQRRQSRGCLDFIRPFARKWLWRKALTCEQRQIGDLPHSGRYRSSVCVRTDQNPSVLLSKMSQSRWLYGA